MHPGQGPPSFTLTHAHNLAARNEEEAIATDWYYRNRSQDATSEALPLLKKGIREFEDAQVDYGRIFLLMAMCAVLAVVVYAAIGVLVYFLLFRH